MLCDVNPFVTQHGYSLVSGGSFLQRRRIDNETRCSSLDELKHWEALPLYLGVPVVHFVRG